MRYELSSRLRTDAPYGDVMNLALAQFQKVSSNARGQNNERIIATGIESTFGSANRYTCAIVTARPAPDGWVLVADVTYRPSFFMWILLILGLFTMLLWVVPIIMYMSQKSAVRDAIERCLARVRDEVERPVAAPIAVAAPDLIGDLERLAGLKERGVISDEEFAAQKAKLLGKP